MASPNQTSLSSTEGGSTLLSPYSTQRGSSSAQSSSSSTKSGFPSTQSGSGMQPGPSVVLPTSNQGDTGLILSQAGALESSGNPTYCLKDGVEVVILGCKLGF